MLSAIAAPEALVTCFCFCFLSTSSAPESELLELLPGLELSEADVLEEEELSDEETSELDASLSDNTDELEFEPIDVDCEY